MARRRSDTLNSTPAAPLHAEGLADRIKTTCRQRKTKQLFVVSSLSSTTGVNSQKHHKLNKESPHSNTSGVSARTRAQTKGFLVKKSSRRVLRGRRVKKRQQQPPPAAENKSDKTPSSSALSTPTIDAACPTTATPTPSSSNGTVAAPSPRPAGGHSGKRASRCRWELRALRDKPKVETPPEEPSSQGLADRSLPNNDQDNVRVAPDPVVAAVSDDDAADKLGREQQPLDGAVAQDNSDADNVGHSDNGVDGARDCAEGLGNGGHSGDEEEEEDDGDGSGDEEEEEEEGDEDQDGGCTCTSNWSCGGHTCQRRAGPSSAVPRLLPGQKRRLSSVDEQSGDDDDDDDASPPKRNRTNSKTRHCLRPSSRSGLSSPSQAVNKVARQRIPSREHPPPKLAGWLDTFKSWSNAERMMALDDLIALCEPSQVRHMMHVIEPQFQRDFISLLPKELALYVLSYLEPRDLLRAAQTCRYWHILCEDNLLWREKCREEGIDEMLVYGSRLRRRPGLRSPFKSLFMSRMQIEHNWRKGVTRPPKILKGHDDHVITCLEFCGQRIVSGSDDNTLKVWSVITGKCLRNLVGHTGGVWSSQMAGNIIISGSTDRTLKVWNADTGALKHTLYGHTSTVRCMSLCANIVVSGSRDATLRVWDIENGHCLHTLMGHVAAVRCVQYDGRRIVSGAYDYTVRVWDPDTETCLHTLQGHSNRVYSLQFDGVHVVSGSLDTSIRVWDVETGACLHTLIGHQSLTSGLELKDNILVSGNADSTVKVWDITTGQCLQTLQGPNKHQSAVTCLQFSKKFVITSSDDGTVKIWDLKTGEFLRNLVSLDSGGSGGVVWRLRCSNTKLVCAVGSRNGTEETKLMVLDFDVDDKKAV